MDLGFDLVLPNINDLPESKKLQMSYITFIKYLEILLDNNHHICNTRSDYITDYYATIDFTNDKYTLPSNYINIRNCKGIYILPIRIAFKESDYSHLNMIIIDNLRRTIDFYEPHGVIFNTDNQLYSLYNIYKHVEIIIRSHLKLNYKINNVHIECPIGLQTIQQNYLKKSTLSCVPLNLLIIATKVNNLNIPTSDIVRYFLNMSPKSLDSYIRRWITYINNSILHNTKHYKSTSDISIVYTRDELHKIYKYIETQLTEYLTIYDNYNVTDVSLDNVLRFYKLPNFNKVFFNIINKYYNLNMSENSLIYT